jgi:hypothetical protein
MKITQRNWIKLVSLCGFIFFTIHLKAQETAFRYLDMNTILKDKKIQILKSQLIKGWSMRANGSNFFIERKEDIFLPQSALKSVDTKAAVVAKNVGGKKVLFMKTKAFFLMTIEKKLPTEKVKQLKATAKAIYQTDYYTIFLWQEHGFTYSKQTIPSNLQEEFQTIETLMGSQWQ